MNLGATTPISTDSKAQATLRQLSKAIPLRPGPLLDLLASDGQDPRKVTAIIERDPAMTARVLGVVNSAGTRTLHEITELSRAVLQLGAPKVRLLGMAMGVQMMAEGLALPDELARSYWTASLRKAEAADLAATTLDPQRKPSAYSIGLIADLGLPALMALDPAFYLQRLPLRSANATWCEAERQHFGLDHAQVGAHLLTQWQVNPSTVHRVRHHHQLPEAHDDAGLTLALFIAGLLPHDDGEIDPLDLDRLMTVHAKVLRVAFATPDAFLGQVYADANRRMNRDTPRDAQGQLKVQPFLDAMASNTIHLIGQLCKLEHNHNKSREDLSTLRFEAFTDPLTKVLNRRGFFSLAEQRIEKSMPLGTGVCCMLMDLNGFKPINDQFGHDAGDLMLRGLAKLLRRSVNRNDLIGRLGGDEFVVLLTDIDEHAARTAAARLRDTCLDKRIRIAPNMEVPLSMSIGASFHPLVGSEVKLDQLVAAADELMYQRKRSKQPGLIFATYGDPTAVNGGSSLRGYAL